MLNNKFSMTVLATAMFVSSAAWAASGTVESSHDGKFISVSGDKLTMTNKDGKEHSHTLVIEAKVTCDGIACKASDLKAGMKIRVTTKKGDQTLATNVEAIENHTLFANTHDGKLVKIENNKLTMMDSQGKEHSHLILEGTTMTCDCKNCSTEHLKVGMKIRVTTKFGPSGDITHIEAIDKDAAFSEIN